jgi:catalase
MGVSTTKRQSEPTGKQLVEWTENDFPGRTPGTRAAHTTGIGASGTFTPSPVIANFCTAPQFNSGVIPVLARFSNGSGLKEEHDLHTDARGLAVKFFRGTDDEADMVAMTLPLFFVRNGADFEALSKASVPVPVRKLRIRWWQQLLLDLQLKVPPAAPPTDVDTAIDPAHLTEFAKRHPEAKSAVAALSGLVNPTSYGRAAYHGVHAFRMTGPDGVERPVRYTWEPFLGVRSVTEDQKQTLPNDHLHRDLRARLAAGTISFALQFTVGEQGDDTTDPTTPWPVRRPRITGGVLKLDAVVADQEADQERVSYNPTRTLAGFVPFDDDLLIQARGAAYRYSCEQRGGSGCPVMHSGSRP